MKRSIIRIASFMLILCVLLICINQVLKFKDGDGIYDMYTFYELEDDTVDVLILGSSHAYQHFNTGTLWNEYGMASYVLGGSSQPLWNTYYYLKEALKTQTPELIVLEGGRVVQDVEFEDDMTIIRNTFGMKRSQDKLDAIKISSPKERWGEFILGYTQYHTRYSDLSKADFYKNQGNPLFEDWKGFGCNLNVEPREAIDVTGVDTRNPLYEKAEEYYRKTIELAQENNIPIVVVVSPFSYIEEEMEAVYNTAGDIASEYGVDFIECNLLLDEIGIDYATDAADFSHLNWRGNQKFSHYIGARLKDEFVISDRRGDVNYASWQRNADYISQMIYNRELTEVTDLDSIIDKILNENYWLFISVDGRCTTADVEMESFYSTMGITSEEINGVWYRDNAYGIEWYAQGESDEKYISTDAHDFYMKRWMDDRGHYNNQIIIDNIEYLKVGNGINIVVYDTVTERVVDSFGLNSDDNYNIVR